MGPTDFKAAKAARAHTPSPSNTSDDINFTGCEKARKIFMALRGKPIPDGNNRDQVISISGSSVPKTANTAGPSASGPSRDGEAASIGRASNTASQAVKGKKLRITFLFFPSRVRLFLLLEDHRLGSLIHLHFSSINTFILEEICQQDLLSLDPHGEESVSASHSAAGPYKTTKDNRSKGYFPGPQ
jgi:hypothetical protein